MSLVNHNNSKIHISALILLWLIGSILTIVYFFITEESHTTIVRNHINPLIIINKQGSIIGSFTATDNNLGAVKIRLQNSDFVNEVAIFKIKNINERNWYHVSNIVASQFNVIPFYSFGIPIIKKSINQKYVFQIELVHSINKLAILSINKQHPYLITKYQYSKKLLSSPVGLSDFIHKKIISYLSEPNFWRVFIVLHTPLILYLLYLTTHKLLIKIFIKKNSHLLGIHHSLITVSLAMIFIDICIMCPLRNFLWLVVLLIWILRAALYRDPANLTFRISIFLLIQSTYYLSADMLWPAEISASWSLLLLAIGLVQTVLEYRIHSYS